MGSGLAAAALLVVVILPGRIESPEVESTAQTFTAVPPSDELTNVNVNALQALMVESGQLESDLRSLPDQPRVVGAGTQITIIELEDRISAIDFQLSDPEIRMTPEDQE